MKALTQPFTLKLLSGTCSARRQPTRNGIRVAGRFVAAGREPFGFSTVLSRLPGRLAPFRYNAGTSNTKSNEAGASDPFSYRWETLRCRSENLTQLQQALSDKRS